MRRLLVNLVGLATAWALGLVLFVQGMPRPVAMPPLLRADAIVVLTGGSGRVEQALGLLAEGKAPVLFVSGVYNDVRHEELVALAPDPVRAAIKRLPEGAIQLGRSARSTLGNVEETRLWLQNAPQKKIILVTADYHMPRAHALFSTLLPERAWIAVPVFPEDFVRGAWWNDPRSRALVLSEYHKWLAQVPLAWVQNL